MKSFLLTSVALLGTTLAGVVDQPNKSVHKLFKRQDFLSGAEECAGTCASQDYEKFSPELKEKFAKIDQLSLEEIYSAVCEFITISKTCLETACASSAIATIQIAAELCPVDPWASQNDKVIPECVSTCLREHLSELEGVNTTQDACNALASGPLVDCARSSCSAKIFALLEAEYHASCS